MIVSETLVGTILTQGQDDTCSFDELKGVVIRRVTILLLFITMFIIYSGRYVLYIVSRTIFYYSCVKKDINKNNDLRINLTED